MKLFNLYIMKIVKDTSKPTRAKKSIKPVSPILTQEYGRKLRLEFITAHNEKIKKMKVNGTYEKWLGM